MFAPVSYTHLDVYKRQAQVSHESGTAVVTLTAPVEDDTLRRTVEDKGYTVTAIR